MYSDVILVLDDTSGVIAFTTRCTKVVPER